MKVSKEINPSDTTGGVWADGISLTWGWRAAGGLWTF